MNTSTLTKVWDLPLRIFHWLLVLAFTVAYLTEEELLDIHVWAGYLVFALLVFRFVWGFVGSYYSRFSSFLCTPASAIEYFKTVVALRSKRYLGHNPAGAAMIVLLLLSLLMTTLSGFAVYGADQNLGPLAAIGSANEKTWETLHEFFANFTLALVIAHIAGVAIESFIHKESLAKAMMTGNKKSLDK
jgi:cytochrome b